MFVVESIRPLLAVLVSILAVPILLSSRSANIREAWSFVAAGLKFFIVASMVPLVLDGGILEYTLCQVMPGAAIQFRVDAFGLMFALVSSFLWIVTTAYSIGYMRGLGEHSQTRFFCCFALSLSATIGVAFSANLLTMYLFYEMLSLSTYPLVTHHQDDQARSSGRKYLLYLLGPSIALLLPAILIVYHDIGSLDFSVKGLLAQGQNTPTTVLVLLLFFTYGFAKAGLMPLHSWLPAAMVAPTPVSALLHAVAVVKVGAFCVVRTLIFIFGMDYLHSIGLATVICVLASITILVTSLIALSQNDLKRLLAFSTLGQLSYIVLGAALLSESSITGAMVHIAMHAFGKITLFFCAGAILVTTGLKKISQMKGLGKKMPVTMTAFFIGALSVIGLPPCGGFISKWLLAIGALEADRIGFLVVILLSSLLNAAYFLPIVYRAFFCDESECAYQGPAREAPVWTMVPLCLTAVLSVGLFFYPQPFMTLARLAVRSLIGG
ncbi:monovalent cation/H+ antiporter subunit D family protein [bacterium]|nr:monovalent cation/H+ antiporter subunit D family protein [bacterium]